MLRLLGIAILLTGATVAHSAPRTDPAEKTTDPRDKMICKRFIETGSLVKGNRICKTKAEWQRDRDEIRSFTTSNGCGKVGETGACG